MANNATAKTVIVNQMQHGEHFSGQDVVGWYCSEKMDGCRAYWDGAVLYSKSGNVINAPTITDKLPPGMALDGELYAGRGKFETARLFTQFGKCVDQVRFVAFDAPNVVADWPERINKAQACGVACVAISSVTSIGDLAQRLVELQADGGEGFMVRKPGHHYTPGRSDLLLKVKRTEAFFQDQI